MEEKSYGSVLLLEFIPLEGLTMLQKGICPMLLLCLFGFVRHACLIIHLESESYLEWGLLRRLMCESVYAVDYASDTAC